MQPQRDLFPALPVYPDGLLVATDFLDRGEEAALLETLSALPVAEATYRGFVAKRRTMHFGHGYDFTANRLTQAPPLPAALVPLREKVAHWSRVPAQAFVQGLVTEYRTGTPIGWHRDVPHFGIVAGISLGGACRMRFRPYPPKPGWSRDAFTLDLLPRSAYLLARSMRWDWQHSIPDVPAPRWSITFRTMRETAH